MILQKACAKYWYKKGLWRSSSTLHHFM